MTQGVLVSVLTVLCIWILVLDHIGACPYRPFTILNQAMKKVPRFCYATHQDSCTRTSVYITASDFVMTTVGTIEYICLFKYLINSFIYVWWNIVHKGTWEEEEED